MGVACDLGAQPSGRAAALERHVLARSLLMTTERRGGAVVRRPRRWWPGRLRRWLLTAQLRQAERFAAVLPLPLPRLVLLPDGPALMQPLLPNARPLRSLRPQDLAVPSVRAAIWRFWQDVERCWEQTGWLPDVGGRAHLPWELYAPLRSDNVLLDESGQCWLVDPSATAIFHDRRWPTARLHALLMRRALRRCRARWGGAATALLSTGG